VTSLLSVFTPTSLSDKHFVFTAQRLVSDLSGTWLVLQVVAVSVTVARVMPARTTEIKFFINIRCSAVQEAKH